MSYPVYTVPAGDVLPILFDTFDGGTGASITMTGLAVTDIEIYRDGGVTQRASDAGYTLLDTDGIDFDGITGIHGFSINTGDNTDAGFYVTGAWYHVVVSAITVDGQTVNFIAAAFRIMAAETVAGTPAVDATAISGDATAANNAESFFDGTGYAGTNNVIPSVTTVTGNVNGSVASVTGAVGSVTGNVGGNVVGSVASVTGAINTAAGTITTLDELDTAQDTQHTQTQSDIAGLNDPTAAAIADAVWDEDATGHQTGGTFGQAIGDPGANTETIYDAVVTDAAGTNIAADIIALDAVADSILVDSNELQTDWANGGRLDLILDARASQTSVNDVPTTAEFNARTLVSASYATAANQTNIEADTQDIQSRLPASLNNGVMPADIQRINDVAIVGDGQVGTEFDVA